MDGRTIVNARGDTNDIESRKLNMKGEWGEYSYEAGTKGIPTVNLS